jgi:hypothetical protein
MEWKGCDIVIDKVCATANVEENDIKPPVVNKLATMENDQINIRMEQKKLLSVCTEVHKMCTKVPIL